MSWLEKKEDTFKNFYDGECLKKKNETSSHFSFQVYIFFKISDTHYCGFLWNVQRNKLWEGFQAL